MIRALSDLLLQYCKSMNPRKISQFLARGYPVALRENGQQERTVVGIWDSLDVALKWCENPGSQECLEVLGDGAVRDIQFLEHI